MRIVYFGVNLLVCQVLPGVVASWGYALQGPTAVLEPNGFCPVLGLPLHGFLAKRQPPLGVYHPSGLPYLFGNVSTYTPLKIAQLSRAVVNY